MRGSREDRKGKKGWTGGRLGRRKDLEEMFPRKWIRRRAE